MNFAALPTELDAIRPWRDMYRLEMSCQIVHDSIHSRPGWTQEYSLHLGDRHVGYGSLAIAGPWKDAPAIYEFYVVPQHRSHVFALFRALLDASPAVKIEVQSNDPLITNMLHTFAQNVSSESILFEDAFTTSHAPGDAVFRQATVPEAPDTPTDQLMWRGVIEVQGQLAATGGVLFHYNPPYGDIYMDVVEPFRRRGFGAFLVQELKRLCYERGRVPAARCNVANVASRGTLQKAGFVPCGHILTGAVPGNSSRANET